MKLDLHTEQGLNGRNNINNHFYIDMPEGRGVQPQDAESLVLALDEMKLKLK